jgi:hypothetical protein
MGGLSKKTTGLDGLFPSLGNLNNEVLPAYPTELAQFIREPNPVGR